MCSITGKSAADRRSTGGIVVLLHFLKISLLTQTWEDLEGLEDSGTLPPPLLLQVLLFSKFCSRFFISQNFAQGFTFCKFCPIISNATTSDHFHSKGESEKPEAGSSFKRLPRALSNRRRLWNGNDSQFTVWVYMKYYIPNCKQISISI